MIIGRIDPGSTPVVLAQDTKIVSLVEVPRRLLVPSLRILLDTKGGGGGAQVARPVIYDTTMTLVAAGDETQLAAGLDIGLFDWTFSALPEAAADLPEAGIYWMGLHGGPAGSVIRMYA